MNNTGGIEKIDEKTH